MADMDHEAAKKTAELGSNYFSFADTINLARAYLDLRAQITERNARIAELENTLHYYSDKGDEDRL
jgi:hypothetical protein